MYSIEQYIVDQIMTDLGIPIPPMELTEHMTTCGLDDPDVFTPMKGIREAIDTVILESCD